jgi:SAM-dependent methyltransferase
MTADAFRCRASGSANLETVLDLGRTPLANRLLTAEQLGEPEPTYPLKLVFCPDSALAQITETVPPEQLFGQYLYFSSFSDTMLEHARRLVGELIERRGLTADSRVVEVASNDGYLLQYYRQRGVPVLGIEPAENVAEVARRERGIETLNEFFGRDLARRLADEGQRADVIHAHNVMAHVADLPGFVDGLATLLKPDGVACVEAPYVHETIRTLQFDQVYHEHLCYFGATSMQRLLERHGLTLIDVSLQPIHGGSLRYLIQHRDHAEAGPSVAEWLDRERQLGMTESAYYRDFAARVHQLKADLTQLLNRLKSNGDSIAVYGASAKGATLLNYFGVGSQTLDFVADRSPHKQGRFTPGTHLPIVDPDQLTQRRPDYCLLLTWNFRDEILAQQQAYRDAGGKFIVPLPTLEVV